MMSKERIIIRPQKGPQEKFLATSADIAIYGGAAGGGKTYALLLDPLRYINVRGYNAIILRKEYMQITTLGGLRDESVSIYGNIKNAVYQGSPKIRWIFNHGKAVVGFDYIGKGTEKEMGRWQGSQATFIGFDELTHFSQYSFFYMLSRNRSTCGVKPYIRATCNPDADSWVRNFISWWIDQETGYPIQERSGKIRYFFRSGGNLIWGDSVQELERLCHDIPEFRKESCKSVTFIASSVYDNKELLKINPSYLANLAGLPVVERERLLKGNWKIRPAAGLYFKREQTRIVKSIPDKIVAIARAWDLAATEITPENSNPDRTASCLMARMKNGQFIILDAKRVAFSASQVRKLVRSTAVTDKAEYKCNKVSIPQDPGQAGKEQSESYRRELSGFNVISRPVSSDKVHRAEPLAAQWQSGNVLLLEGPWNDTLLSELEGFPDAAHDDQVDAASDAFALVAYANNFELPPDSEILAHDSYWIS